MGSYTSMTNLATGDLVPETDMDTIRTNIEYLLSPNHSVIKRNNGTDYTNTNTTWAAVDGTNLAATITTHGGPVLVSVNVNVAVAANMTVYFDVYYDGTSYTAGHANGIWFGNLASTATVNPVHFTILIDGLAAGSHTFTLYWKGSAANTKTMFSSALYGTAKLSAIEL